jgi:hypothetical protein
MFAIVAKMNSFSSELHHSNNIYLANISYEGPPKSFRPDEEMYSVLVIFGIVSIEFEYGLSIWEGNSIDCFCCVKSWTCNI